MPATRKIVRKTVGVVGALGLAGCLVSVAAAARADECSGLMCIFKTSPAQPAAQQPPPQPIAAPQTVQSAEAGAADVASEAAPKARSKAKPRPVPVVTIAAGPAEMARLKALAAVMRTPRVKLVEAKKGAATADFAVTTAADGQGGARLFTEQMHIIAGPKVATLADLQGKVVSFGAEHSASQAAARKVFEAQGIKVAETALELDNALDGLATGDVDAIVVLSPQPDARLSKVKGAGLHLVAWPQAATPPDGTVAATIDGSAYPGLAKPGEKVATLGVDAVLAVGQKTRSQPAAKAFLGALAQHSAVLSKRGFDLIRADLEARRGRRVANAEAR